MKWPTGLMCTNVACGQLELRVILFPIFVHAYLDLVEKDLKEEGDRQS